MRSLYTRIILRYPRLVLAAVAVLLAVLGYQANPDVGKPNVNVTFKASHKWDGGQRNEHVTSKPSWSGWITLGF